jgi:hypothetical protein
MLEDTGAKLFMLIEKRMARADTTTIDVKSRVPERKPIDNLGKCCLSDLA